LIVDGEQCALGKAFVDVGVLLSRDPDCVFAPDAAFVGAARLPVRESPQGYLETIPDLVVEVRSRNDSLAWLARKAQKYLRAGVRVVWVVDEEARHVTVYRSEAAPLVVGEKDVLTADPIIPGFRLPLAELYRE
jgi:Uma2 family endonuclease